MEDPIALTPPAPIGRRALVWGARGFIGHALVTDLLLSGWQVRALSRERHDPNSVWSDQVEWITLGRPNLARSFDAALDGCAVVFNLAGTSGAVASNHWPLKSLDGNCRIQLEFLSACARAQIAPHVVFASSRLVYAPAGTRAVDEEAPTGPRSMYAAHKLCVEHYHRILAQRSDLTYTICRISNPFGLDPRAGGKGYGFVNDLILRAAANAELTLFGLAAQLRDYLYIGDLTRALRLFGEAPGARNETFNVGQGVSRTLQNAAEQICACFGGGRVAFRPWPREHADVESGDFVMDVSKACARLGFGPAFTFEEGLAAVRQQLEVSAEARATRESPHGQQDWAEFEQDRRSAGGH